MSTFAWLMTLGGLGIVFGILLAARARKPGLKIGSALILVISGLVLLFPLAEYALHKLTCENPRQLTRGYMGVIKDATETYFQMKHRYPEVTSAKDSGAQLYQQLAACPGSANRISDLPREAYVMSPMGFADGWGRAMRYDPKGEANGKPVLISAGPDGDFGDTDPKAAEDNLRSDSN